MECHCGSSETTTQKSWRLLGIQWRCHRIVMIVENHHMSYHFMGIHGKKNRHIYNILYIIYIYYNIFIYILLYHMYPKNVQIYPTAAVFVLSHQDQSRVQQTR